jgi:hypothetical protein
MANRDLVGRCGLYCGACIIYRAYVDSAESFGKGLLSERVVGQRIFVVRVVRKT